MQNKLTQPYKNWSDGLITNVIVLLNFFDSEVFFKNNP